MTLRILLELTSDTHDAIQRHLFPPDSEVEQAAFGFVERRDSNACVVFRMVDWLGIPPSGFAIQTGYHIELTDEIRASTIKRAHDTGTCIVEFHSHTGPWPASFSPSDRMGFREFIPHVWWRLKGRPYLALVATRSGYDGLAWLSDPKVPVRVSGLRVDATTLACTGLTPLVDTDDE